MRQALSFACEDDTLVATLDEAPGETGLLIVTGGRQTRIGPHRLMAELGRAVATAGMPVFRFDRRGVGDSGGCDPGFRDSGPDIAAAAAAFRASAPNLRQIVGLGLCDGATALALHHRDAGLASLILLNPWLVEAASGDPAPAAVRAYYIERLLSLDSWRTLVTRGLNLIATLRGIRVAASRTNQSLATDVMASLDIPATILLTERDATARAFLSVYAGPARIIARDSGSHSFASLGDRDWLFENVIAGLSGQETASKRA